MIGLYRTDLLCLLCVHAFLWDLCSDILICKTLHRLSSDDLVLSRYKGLEIAFGSACVCLRYLNLRAYSDSKL